MSANETDVQDSSDLETATISDFGGTPEGYADECADPDVCAGVNGDELPCFSCYCEGSA